MNKILKLLLFSDLIYLHATSCLVDNIYLPETSIQVQNTEECSRKEVKIQSQSDKDCDSAAESIKRKSLEKYIQASIRQV